MGLAGSSEKGWMAVSTPGASQGGVKGVPSLGKSHLPCKRGLCAALNCSWVISTGNLRELTKISSIETFVCICRSSKKQSTLRIPSSNWRTMNRRLIYCFKASCCFPNNSLNKFVPPVQLCTQWLSCGFAEVFQPDLKATELCAENKLYTRAATP